MLMLHQIGTRRWSDVRGGRVVRLMKRMVVVVVVVVVVLTRTIKIEQWANTKTLTTQIIILR